MRLSQFGKFIFSIALCAVVVARPEVKFIVSATRRQEISKSRIWAQRKNLRNWEDFLEDQEDLQLTKITVRPTAASSSSNIGQRAGQKVTRQYS